jgi:hypothetical protein
MHAHPYYANHPGLHRHNDEMAPGPRLEEIAELSIGELEILCTLVTCPQVLVVLYKKPRSRDKPQLEISPSTQLRILFFRTTQIWNMPQISQILGLEDASQVVSHRFPSPMLFKDSLSIDEDLDVQQEFSTLGF